MRRTIFKGNAPPAADEKILCETLEKLKSGEVIAESKVDLEENLDD